MELILVALIGVMGGGVLEFIRRGFDNQDERETELENQVTLLSAKVDKLIEEVDKWKKAYYELLASLSNRTPE